MEIYEVVVLSKAQADIEKIANYIYNINNILYIIILKK